MRYVRLVLGWLLGTLLMPRARAGNKRRIEGLRLYQFQLCPFCLKVHKQLDRLAIQIEEVDIDRDLQARAHLLRAGGKVQVPCLRIADPEGERWLYESSAINAYLQERVNHGS